MTTGKQPVHPSHIRIPDSMYQELLKEAKRNQRSLSKHVVFLLQEHKELKTATK